MSVSQLHEYSHRGFESDRDKITGKLQKVSPDNFILQTGDGYVYSKQSHYDFNPTLSTEKSNLKGILYITNDQTFETKTVYILDCTTAMRLDKFECFLRIGFKNDNLTLTTKSIESDEVELDTEMRKLEDNIQKTKKKISKISEYVTSKNVKKLEAARDLLAKQEMEAKETRRFNITTTSWEFSIPPSSECYIDSYRIVYIPSSVPRQAKKQKVHEDVQACEYGS